jgi:hypothetical protein
VGFGADDAGPGAGLGAGTGARAAVT